MTKTTAIKVGRQTGCSHRNLRGNEMRSWLLSRLVWPTVLFALAGAVLLDGAAWAARSGRSTALSSGTLTITGVLHGHWKLSKYGVPGTTGAASGCTVYPIAAALGPASLEPQPAVDLAFSGSSPPLVPLTIYISGVRASSKHVNLATTTTYGVRLLAWSSGWGGSVLVERGSGTLSMSPTRTSGTINTEMGVAGKPPGQIHLVASWSNCKPAG